jgi:hypothetical protein
LPRAVWSHNTSICRATKFTSFKLLYGEELVTPEEIKIHSARTRAEAIHSPTEAESKDLLETGMRESNRKIIVLPERDKSMERQESKAKAHRSWRPSVTPKPAYGGLRKIGV